MMTRRHLFTVAAAGLEVASARIGYAQAYPTRPITLIVSAAAGSSSDVIARVLVERMRESHGQPILIENVSGANGSIGVGRVARAKPDGYTIDIGYLGAHVLNGAFYSLPYDLLNDFAPIAALTAFPVFLFTRKTIPARDLNELIAWLKANPDKASAGISSSGVHLLTTLFQKETGTSFAFLPYRGTGPAMQDLVAGQIDMLFDTPVSLSLLRAGSITAFAVTSDTRWATASDIPTFAEMGLPAVSNSSWYGFFAPRGTPKDIIGRLNAAAVEALADPAVRSRLADLGMEVFPRGRQTPEALSALQKADAEKWWPIIKASGIRVE
jgi:tripartite-type tricarboxylate transporter receptor subunit TctC